MSRPPSGRPLSATTKGMKHPRGDVISYEDLLVAQYLEELRKSPNKNSMHPLVSPYTQKVAFTHIVPTPKFYGESLRPRRSRPHSAGVMFRPHSATAKPKMDPKFIADPEMYDPLTPRDQKKKKTRPFSAPSYRRPFSATYGSRPSSAKSSAFSIYSTSSGLSVYGRRARSQYKKSPTTIVATAFKNGSRDVSCRVAAPTIKMLLEMCTDRLNLPHAARKVFLTNGHEVSIPQQIPRDAEIYISMGEKFKNPYKSTEKHTEIQRNMAWTLNGLAWFSDAKRRATRPQLSKRMQQMLEPSKRRVLVFKNGSFRDGAEIVADPERFEDFLVDCTDRLQLEAYARVLYNWNGEEVHDLLEAPQLEGCLQAWATPVLGPLWVSKGEGFSPTGPAQFFSQLLRYNDAKKKEAKHYESQLRMALNPEKRDKVKIAAILSMSEDEIDEALKVVTRDIFEFTEALSRLKEEIRPMLELEIEEIKYEKDTKESYKYKYLKEYDIDGDLLGKKGMKLKVYINGSLEDEATVYFNMAQATRGVVNDPAKLMARLLDECSSHHGLAQPKSNTKIKAMAQRLYDNLGNEISNVHDLTTDQEVWLSFGEPWKNPYTFVLSIQVDKIRGFDVQGQKRAAIREQLHAEDVKDMAADGNDKMSAWDVVSGVPEAHDWLVIGLEADPSQKAEIMSQLETEVDLNGDFVVNKNTGMVLYAEPIADTKKKRGSKEIWPSESQQWLITKHGTHLMIHSKYHKNLVLGVSQYPLVTTLTHPLLGRTETKVEGYLVLLQRRTDDSTQLWNFTEHGTIESARWPELRLTYLGSRFGDEESHTANEKEEVPRGIRNYIAVCQKLTGKDAKSQRWAMKQEKIENLGQWKHTQSDNTEWKKLAYSWPVDQEGNVVEDYDWPMEGFMLPYAPPFKVKDNKDNKDDKNRLPLRLMCLKNGVRDVAKALAVVGPDLRNMKKDVSGNKLEKNNKKNKQLADGTRSTDTGTDSYTGTGENGLVKHDDDLTVLKLEFILFLERCTGLLNLPFAARRIFDEAGKEHFSLTTFKRDQLVFISCGEPWSDPNLSKAEQQRRYLLANLGSDVAKIAQYIALRDPKGLVLEAEALTPGAKIYINKTDAARMLEKKTLSQQMKNKVAVKDEFQEFLFEGRTGFISCKAEAELVIGVSRADMAGTEKITLQKRRMGSPYQKWTLNNGLIQLKGSKRVLTAVIPSDVKVKETGLPVTYVGGKVTLQVPKDTCDENQQWTWDEQNSVIKPYANGDHDLTLQVECMTPGAQIIINHAAPKSKKLDEDQNKEEEKKEKKEGETEEGKLVSFNPKGQKQGGTSNSKKISRQKGDKTDSKDSKDDADKEKEEEDEKCATSGDHQVFQYDSKGDYIYCGGQPSLVLGVEDGKVVLQKRDSKNSHQHWNLGNGVIASRSSSLLLTAIIPRDVQTNVDGIPETFTSCEVVMADKTNPSHGGQQWSYDPERRSLDAFNTSGNKELVLELEGMTLGSRVVVNERKPEQVPKKLDYHSLSHKASEKRLSEMKYPWERTTADVHNSTDINTSMDTTLRRSQSRKSASRGELQEFVYDVKDGYISCASDPHLVLGMREAEGSVTEVTIQRRYIDDISQRWNMDNGLITAKSSGKVLTVIMPSDIMFDEDGQPLTYIGSEVALQVRKKTTYGRANQLWKYDPDTKLIQAFYTKDIKDKEITAANKASVCTYAVMEDMELEQPGYQVELPTKNGSKLLKVCSACARAMRGRHKLECITGKLSFACAMGKAKEYGIKQIGSFQCLNGKVKLTTNEAKHTLNEWEKQLEKLKEELSVRTIAKKISEAEAPPAVKVMAYKNGAGRMKEGQLIIGYSVPAILDQATHRLGLSQAARRLYTADGYMVLDLRDLVQWVQENYAEQARYQLQGKSRSKSAGKLSNTSLMNNVSLEDESEEEEEEEKQDSEEEEESEEEDYRSGGTGKKEVTYGFEVLAERSKVDQKISRCMLVPNPNDAIKQDGFIQKWNFYCVKIGKLFLQVVRQQTGDVYEIIEQVDFDIQEPGEYSIDMTEIPNTPWSGKGIPVRKGDLLAFYCPAECMLTYDVDPSVKQDPLFMQTQQGAPPPASNTPLKMRKWTQDGTRKYSLNALIMEGVTSSTSYNRSNKQAGSKTSGGERVYGDSVVATREKLDNKISRCMLIPNPDVTVIDEDGYITKWNFYCIKTGKLYLQVLRPVGTSEFLVVSQADLQIDEVGEYGVDMTNLDNTPWFGRGMPVKRGDRIGFYCPGECMLNYDVDMSSTQHPYFYQTKPGAPPPAEQEVIKMSKWTQEGTRRYSLNACVRTGVSSSVSTPAKKGVLSPGTRVERKKKEVKKKRGPHVEKPPIELILKYPIEVWVSGGEPFVQPEEVERQFVISRQQREKRSALAYELEKEKHVLRQMQGRRLDEMATGQFKATMNPTHPVLIDGHWQEPTADEQEKHHTVHQLQTNLSDMKTSQKAKPKIYNPDTTKRLYTQPAMKRLLVYPNGESLTRAVYIWGETITQLLDNGTDRLNLRKKARYIFKIDGTPITSMEDIERDEVLCLSYSKTFMQTKETLQNVEIKANWSRARKAYGDQATDISVQAKENPGIDVDPFGPSDLVGDRSIKENGENPPQS